MHIEVLVEEPSCEAALERLLPKLVGPSVTWAIHAHQGKPDLLGKLEGRLRGYAAWMPDDYRIVVLVDRDSEDCHELKRRLEEAAERAGLSGAAPVRLKNRIAIEELEAWFLGDVEALRAVFPKVPASLGRQEAFRDPDAVRGGTAERLEQVLQQAGYMQGGLQKIRLAREVSAHMDPDRNRSRSFAVFCRAIREFGAA